MARDRQGPAVAFQYLGYPVLDDRSTSDSVRAFADTPIEARCEIERVPSSSPQRIGRRPW